MKEKVRKQATLQLVTRKRIIFAFVCDVFVLIIPSVYCSEQSYSRRQRHHRIYIIVSFGVNQKQKLNNIIFLSLATGHPKAVAIT